MTSRSVAIIGQGRAGGSFAAALPRVGWTVSELYRRGDDLAAAAARVDLVLIATPDDAITSVSEAIEPGPAVVAHVAGSVGVDVISAAHQRRAAVHPLMSLPDPVSGSERLLAGGWFATAGDSVGTELVGALGGRHVEVADADRALYHATAAVASNHLTALLGQVERLAASIGLPAEPFLDLCAGSLASVRAVGAARALTGPAARGDLGTLERHLEALGSLSPEEQALYRAMMEAAISLAASRQKD